MKKKSCILIWSRVKLSCYLSPICVPHLYPFIDFSLHQTLRPHQLLIHSSFHPHNSWLWMFDFNLVLLILDYLSVRWLVGKVVFPFLVLWGAQPPLQDTQPPSWVAAAAMQTHHSSQFSHWLEHRNRKSTAGGRWVWKLRRNRWRLVTFWQRIEPIGDFKGCEEDSWSVKKRKRF